MKTKIKVTFALASLLAVGQLVGQSARTPEAQFKAAHDKAEFEGDPKGAIELYKKIVNSKDHGLAAKALLAIGECYQKLGNAEARQAYEQVVQKYADQPEVAAEARRRLAALNIPLSAGLTARQVCTHCGDTDLSPTLDGRSVFTDWDTGDIAMRDLASGNVKRLMIRAGTFAADAGDYPEWTIQSPDSRQLLSWWEPPVGKYQLRIVTNEPGSKPRVLLQEGGEISWIEPGDWSRDGKSALVTIARPDGTWQLAWISVSDGTIRILRSLDWRSHGQHAALSHDGRYVAYSALAVNPKTRPNKNTEVTDEHIYVLPADGSGTETELIKTAAINTDPVWSPDDDFIFYISNVSTKFDLWSMPMRDGKPAGFPSIVKTGIGTVRPIGMTRAGSYYYTEHDVNEEVFIADIAPGTQGPIRPVPLYPAKMGSNPRWSPDGKSVAFLRQTTRNPRVANPINSPTDLVVYTIQSGVEKVYTGASAMEFRPAPPLWFHDGAAILQLAYVAEGGDLRLLLDRLDLRIAGSEPLFRPSNGPFHGAFSPDDKTLYVINYQESRPGQGGKGKTILARNLATGEQKPVFTAPDSEEIKDLALSPDGLNLAVLVDKGRVYVVPLAGATGQAADDFLGFKGVASRVVWASDSRSIVVNEGTRIVKIPVQGGPSQLILDVPRLGNFDISPDGARLVFSARKSEYEIWALDNVWAALKTSK